MFDALDNRDAWSTIRGFVYQTDITILRWLELEEFDILELEKGEDIDLITKDFENNELRELQQIKHKESNISLNQLSTLELLKNFYLHRVNNKGQRIRFRFVTNTGYVLERPALFPNGDKGIDMWIALSRKNPIDLTDYRLGVLKKHLQKKIAERIASNSATISLQEQLEQAHWIAFSDYLNDTAQLADFITNFEWSFQQPDNQQITATVEELLDTRFPNKDSHVLYSRLFLYVLKLLSTSGIKRLDHSELLQQVALPTLTATENKLIVLLNSMFQAIDLRVAEIEKAVQSQGEQISALYEGINLVKNDAVFGFKLNQLSVGPPAIVLNGSLRTSKVNEITELLSKHSLIAL